ncbi:histidine kinase dimerization/phosphoacceptor domain -containing protein [Sphingomonas sp. AOB5]|uniref:sensor histidine kinase n=1 Tax=Sphingomonas sp. AOB5 TaxID=3034017 RepID=UPI0023FA48D8|nr:histidine kinase dimerization/phosphoacceptor domain -containing protein [Sphingomonas sp. AOB5]MDF7775750.1 histidine kinase dimerization/phosphoacceptor domain -containing protein [Sphingomonas sp. AOB5]
MEKLDLPPLGQGPAAAFARMPTGAKVFLILVGALLPLALIALFTTLQTTRSADEEARARLNAVVKESSGVLANVLANHVGELREGLAALERDRGDAPSCTRLAGAFASLSEGGTRFAITDGRGAVLCGQRLAITGVAVLKPGEVDAALVDKGLALRVGGQSGASATAYYPVAALATLGRPSGFVPEYGSALVKADGGSLTLRTLGDGPLTRRETMRAQLGVDDLILQMSMPGAPIASPLMIATVLLVLMWIAASAIGWFVVDRLLIRPLRRLRRVVRAYQPGEVIDPAFYGHLPAAEIRELGDTFRDISRTVQLHEADLAEGLVRQTRLTREVHHRVKNNLQVISSLINFHARGAKGPEASEAYASIQRRVDALAVVHRHHYAEMEENRGIELRPVIGELASNIRATAPPQAAGIGITLEVDPLLVTQDTAVAVAFLITEIVELAITCNPAAQVRISAKALPEGDRAVVRVSSPALVDSTELQTFLENRYSRVMTGLARQLRTQLHHDPLTGAYEASIAVNGRP